MPKLLKILEEPHDFLRQVVKPVQDPTTTEIKVLIEDMILTMRKANGIGLAAIQVHIDARVIVVDTKDGALSMINPEIVSRSKEFEIGEEGCLSVPGQFGMVKRSKSVKMTGLDVEGKELVYDAEGLFARVLQHEIDHLNGILFIDSLEDFQADRLEEVNVAM